VWVSAGGLEEKEMCPGWGGGGGGGGMGTAGIDRYITSTITF